MKAPLRAFARGLEALRQLGDLAGIVLITGLFVLFGLQFQHPPKWDTFAVVMQLRRLLDPLLSGIASALDLAWPAEKPSFLPIVLTVAIFFVRSLASHSIERATVWIRSLAAKQPLARKRRASAPAPEAVGAAREGLPPPGAATPPAPLPAEAPMAVAVEPPAQASTPGAAVDPGTQKPAAEAAPASPTPLPQEGALLSDFLHFDPGAGRTPSPSDATPRSGGGRSSPSRTPTPVPGRRPLPAAAHGPFDQEGPTLGHEAAPPPVFGRYELLEELGRGGMGVVYKARDPKIDRIVAIKSILTSHDDDETIDEYERRFRREILAVGKLTHPAIVTVYDFIEDHLGRPAMVMEYVEGETLQHLATRQRPELLRSLEIVIQAAEALDHAHAHGIVHRDVKPANILIGRDGRAKVSDFGIAKVGGMTLTKTQGKLLGTPAFMSPEQFMGRTLDGRTDIFSLGAILYWLCAGERPFVGEALATLAYQVVHLTPASVRERNPELPPQIDAILSRCLAKSVESRYQRALDLAEDLKALRDGRPLPSLGKAAQGDTGTTLVDDATVVEVIDAPPREPSKA